MVVLRDEAQRFPAANLARFAVLTVNAVVTQPLLCPERDLLGHFHLQRLANGLYTRAVPHMLTSHTTIRGCATSAMCSGASC